MLSTVEIKEEVAEWLDDLRGFAIESQEESPCEGMAVYVDILTSDWSRRYNNSLQCLCMHTLGVSKIRPLSESLHDKMILFSCLYPGDHFAKQYFEARSS